MALITVSYEAEFQATDHPALPHHLHCLAEAAAVVALQGTTGGSERTSDILRPAPAVRLLILLLTLPPWGYFR